MFFLLQFLESKYSELISQLLYADKKKSVRCKNIPILYSFSNIDIISYRDFSFKAFAIPPYAGLNVRFIFTKRKLSLILKNKDRAIGQQNFEK